MPYIHKPECWDLPLIGLLESINQSFGYKPSFWNFLVTIRVCNDWVLIFLISCSVTTSTLLSEFLQSKSLFITLSQMAFLRFLSKGLSLMPCLRKVLLPESYIDWFVGAWPVDTEYQHTVWAHQISSFG